MAFVADCLRLYALFKEGGIYLDTDVVVFKNLTNYQGFIGFEDENNLNAAIMGANQGHPFIGACL